MGGDAREGCGFDLRLENLEAKSANLQDAYKAGTPEAEPLVAKVPVLRHDGLTLVESALVAEYAARAFPGGEAIAYADAAEAYGGGLFVAQFNAITPAYFRALRAKSQRTWTPPSTTFARGFDRRSARWPSRSEGRTVRSRVGRDSPSPT